MKRESETLFNIFISRERVGGITNSQCTNRKKYWGKSCKELRLNLEKKSHSDFQNFSIFVLWNYWITYLGPWTLTVRAKKQKQAKTSRLTVYFFFKSGSLTKMQTIRGDNHIVWNKFEVKDNHNTQIHTRGIKAPTRKRTHKTRPDVFNKKDTYCPCTYTCSYDRGCTHARTCTSMHHVKTRRKGKMKMKCGHSFRSCSRKALSSACWLCKNRN